MTDKTKKPLFWTKSACLGAAAILGALCIRAANPSNPEPDHFASVTVAKSVVAVGEATSATATCTCEGENVGHSLGWGSCAPLSPVDTDGSDGTITAGGAAGQSGVYSLSAACQGSGNSALLTVVKILNLKCGDKTSPPDTEPAEFPIGEEGGTASIAATPEPGPWPVGWPKWDDDTVATDGKSSIDFPIDVAGGYSMTAHCGSSSASMGIVVYDASISLPQYIGVNDFVSLCSDPTDSLATYEEFQADNDDYKAPAITIDDASVTTATGIQLSPIGNLRVFLAKPWSVSFSPTVEESDLGHVHVEGTGPSAEPDDAGVGLTYKALSREARTTIVSIEFDKIGYGYANPFPEVEITSPADSDGELAPGSTVAVEYRILADILEEEDRTFTVNLTIPNAVGDYQYVYTSDPNRIGNVGKAALRITVYDDNGTLKARIVTGERSHKAMEAPPAEATGTVTVTDATGYADGSLAEIIDVEKVEGTAPVFALPDIVFYPAKPAAPKENEASAGLGEQIIDYRDVAYDSAIFLRIDGKPTVGVNDFLPAGDPGDDGQEDRDVEDEDLIELELAGFPECATEGTVVWTSLAPGKARLVSCPDAWTVGASVVYQLADADCFRVKVEGRAESQAKEDVAIRVEVTVADSENNPPGLRGKSFTATHTLTVADVRWVAYVPDGTAGPQAEVTELKINDQAPQIEITTPADTDTVAYGGPVTVTGKVRSFTENPDAITVEVNGVAAVVALDPANRPEGPYAGTFTVDLPNVDGGAIEAKVVSRTGAMGFDNCWIEWDANEPLPGNGTVHALDAHPAYVDNAMAEATQDGYFHAVEVRHCGMAAGFVTVAGEGRTGDVGKVLAQPGGNGVFRTARRIMFTPGLDDDSNPALRMIDASGSPRMGLAYDSGDTTVRAALFPLPVDLKMANDHQIAQGEEACPGLFVRNERDANDRGELILRALDPQIPADATVTLAFASGLATAVKLYDGGVETALPITLTAADLAADKIYEIGGNDPGTISLKATLEEIGGRILAVHHFQIHCLQPVYHAFTYDDIEGGLVAEMADHKLLASFSQHWTRSIVQKLLGKPTWAPIGFTAGRGTVSTMQSAYATCTMLATINRLREAVGLDGDVTRAILLGEVLNHVDATLAGRDTWVVAMALPEGASAPTGTVEVGSRTPNEQTPVSDTIHEHQLDLRANTDSNGAFWPNKWNDKVVDEGGPDENDERYDQREADPGTFMPLGTASRLKILVVQAGTVPEKKDGQQVKYCLSLSNPAVVELYATETGGTPINFGDNGTNKYDSFGGQDGLPTVLWAEAKAAEECFVEAWIEVDGNAAEIREKLRLCVIGVDLNIDSDNNDGFDLPDRSPAENALKMTSPGKLLCVNDNDKDGDGIPDFADGYDYDGDGAGDDAVATVGEQFVPLVLTVPETVDPATALFKFTYKAAHPMKAGLRTGLGTAEDPFVYNLSVYDEQEEAMRIWTKTGDTLRNGYSVLGADTNADGVLDTFGDFIPSGTTIPGSKLPFQDAQAVLWLEGIHPGERVIKVELDPDGPNTTNPATKTAPFLASDQVKATIIKVDINGDYNRDGNPADDPREADAVTFEGPKGFAILANNDDDNADGIPDAMDNMINGTTDVSDVAELHVARLGIPAAAIPVSFTAEFRAVDPSTGNLSNAVRIFPKRVAEQYGGSKFTLTNEQVKALLAGTGTCVMGIEGIAYGKEARIEFILKDGANVFGRDEIRVLVSPYFVSPPYHPAEEVFVSFTHVDDVLNAFTTGLSGIAPFRKSSDYPPSPPVPHPGGSSPIRFIQDHVQFGYTRTAQGQSIFKSMPVILGISATDPTLVELLANDRAYYAELIVERVFGDLIVTPPTSAQPHGRVICGNDFAYRDFLKRQKVQTIDVDGDSVGDGDLVELDVSWLSVPHVDNLVAIIPYGTGYKVLVADLELAINLLNGNPTEPVAAPFFFPVHPRDIYNSPTNTTRINQIKAKLNTVYDQLEAGLGVPKAQFIRVPVAFDPRAATFESIEPMLPVLVNLQYVQSETGKRIFLPNAYFAPFYTDSTHGLKAQLNAIGIPDSDIQIVPTYWPFKSGGDAHCISNPAMNPPTSP